MAAKVITRIRGELVPLVFNVTLRSGATIDNVTDVAFALVKSDVQGGTLVTKMKSANQITVSPISPPDPNRVVVAVTLTVEDDNLLEIGTLYPGRVAIKYDSESGFCERVTDASRFVVKIMANFIPLDGG